MWVNPGFVRKTGTFSGRFELCAGKCCYLRQVHGMSFAGWGEARPGSFKLCRCPAGTDGLITLEPHVVLMAHAPTAPAFLRSEAHCIGLAHAGWRGAVAGMGSRMVKQCANAAAAGKSAGGTVSVHWSLLLPGGSEVVEAVPRRFRQQVLQQAGNSFYLDLPGCKFRSPGSWD